MRPRGRSEPRVISTSNVRTSVGVGLQAVHCTAMSAKSRIVPGGGPAADTSSPVAIDIEERPENEGSTTQDAQPPQDASQEGTGAGDADMEAEEEEEDIDDDPNLLASYPIYLSNSLPSTSELQLFQYPTYPRRQPLPVPTSSRQRGLNQAIRWRKNAGWVQVELPLDLRKSVYDEEKGSEMGRGAQHLGKEIGAQRAKADESDEDEKPGKKRRKDKKGKGRAAEEEEEERNRPKRLEKIRLESDLMPNMTKYCVGVMRNRESRWPQSHITFVALMPRTVPTGLYRRPSSHPPRQNCPTTTFNAPPRRPRSNGKGRQT